MSEIFTVKYVGAEPREWTSSHGGTFLSYKVDLEQEDGKVAKGVEWARKPESRAPQVDERIAGHLEEGRYGDKFKLDFERTRELSQGTSHTSSERSSAPSGGKSGGWQPESERDPERAARILRQHSQEMALRALAIQYGSLKAEDKLEMEKFITGWADFFDADVLGQAANSAQGSPAPKQAGTPPPTGASPGSSSQSAEETKDVEMALDTAGLTYAPARALVANYMLAQLNPTERLRACNQLVDAADLETQGMTLRAMKQRTEKWTGDPLPEESQNPDDDIPF